MSNEQFQGFGSGAQQFFKELSSHNDKQWFTANKTRYETEVLEPAALFVLALGARLQTSYPEINFGTQRNGSGSIMRINRDIRFSNDKRPYKENLGLVFWIGEGKKVELPCFYFHLDAEHIFFYGGQHMFPKDVLQRYREAVDDTSRGTKLTTILATLEKIGLPVIEEPAYKRVPRGYASDHPRASLLRLGGVGVSSVISEQDATSAELIDLCTEYARKMQPLIEWLHPVNENE